MWMVKVVICLVKHHTWIGSGSRYCLRCGKLETRTGFTGTEQRSQEAGI